ncbi:MULTISPECIES: hypothetical protein [Pseudomonas]|uniref:hypothetical protein n=1 Tax=Pseudomonas TaxID=286 RepID=UPI000796DA7F|nr:hypothetical protein [Pseudomonas aeruginosa]EKL0661419.1 hypothetical protein [Pseudomonas aeruginosa]EKV6888885.1 hypothetical protein [Pseudomonas aeruginosa]EKW1987644.1 hypothetical protein [Pseudomonas aeruginosa]EKW5288970.1 hypothetical protein [Pseudomonas aeruginosa]EKW5495523.1 hypothetical protein [Pseudomonas aeruginosa]
MNLTNQITMTSLELVDFINAHRQQQAEQAGQPFPSEDFPELTHANLLAKVPKVLGETSHSFECDLPDSYGRPRRGYRFPKREACLVAMSYSYELQAAVYDRMTALEEQLKLAPPPQPRQLSTINREFKAALGIAKTAGLQGNQAIFAADRVIQRELGCSPMRLVGVTSLPTEDNERTYTPSELCAKLDGAYKPRELNKLLEDMGLQQHVDLGGKHKEWELTEAGKRHGIMSDTGKVHTTTGQAVYSVRWKASVLDLVPSKIVATVPQQPTAPAQGSMQL